MTTNVEKTQQNIKRCVCLNCPSYATICKIKNANQNTIVSTSNLLSRSHYEKMFCAFEKSNCIHLDKGCICETCANFKDFGLKKGSYCLHTGGQI